MIIKKDLLNAILYALAVAVIAIGIYAAMLPGEEQNDVRVADGGSSGVTTIPN